MAKECSYDGKKMVLCNGMEMYAENNDTRRGIRLLDNLMHLSTGVFTNLGPYHRSGAKDRGLIFNFCPWCGSDLEENWRKPAIESRDRRIKAIEAKRKKVHEPRKKTATKR